MAVTLLLKIFKSGGIESKALPVVKTSHNEKARSALYLVGVGSFSP